MTRRLVAFAIVSCLAVALCVTPADARTVNWVRDGDALTLDPHAVNEGPTHTLNHHIYEPLVIRDAHGKIKPALAVAWRRLEDPHVWEFKLRRGVQFHDGSPFTVDDVLFSFERARSPTSDMRGLLAGVAAVTAPDPYTIRFLTKARDPLLPIRLTDILMMSRAWAMANALAEPMRPVAGKLATSVTKAMGTGPFQLVSRTPGERTELIRNERYWGFERTKSNIRRIVYRPIADDALRLDALLKGDADFLQDMPVSGLQQVAKAPGLKLNIGAENRAIFFGLNVGAQELASSDIKGRNPLSDIRVRHAISVAIDRGAIQRDVMHGQSIPTGIIAPPSVNGYPAELDKIPPPNPEAAKKLIVDAGYPNGFTIAIDCPNDRYVNDVGICKAVVGQLARAGIKARVNFRTKGEHFDVVRSGKSDMYLLGWGVPTFDSEYIFRALFHSRQGAAGDWNGTGYADPEVDRLIEGLASEQNLDTRRETLATLWKKVQAAEIYVPLHLQTLAYGMKDWIDVPVDISNTPKLWQAKVKPAPLPAVPFPDAPKPAPGNGDAQPQRSQ
ncbi:MAG: ABC transporter substrate-binding protein [Hyphomicrobiaceae bacterium]